MPIKQYQDGSSIELKDTTKIQLQSIICFMDEIGYTYHKRSGRFVSKSYPMNKGRKYLSLSTAQRWHNGNFLKEGAKLVYTAISGGLSAKQQRILAVFNATGIPVVMWNRAEDRKLVDKTHLQYSKKNRKIITVDHQIKFV